ncbi:MAG: hypothetical protein ACYDH6_08355 [Acidimicrobiales bacterium]
MTCAGCAFDPANVTPADAIVALRSLPRRFGELLSGDAGDPDGPDAERPDRDGQGGGGPDADRARARRLVLAHAGQAATAITAITADLERVLATDDPALASDARVATAPADDPSAPTDDPTALERLATAAAAAAGAASHQPADAWTRTGRRRDGTVTAGELLREAVHAGVHHLRAAEDEMEQTGPT